MKARTESSCFKLVSAVLPKLAWSDILQYYIMCEAPDVVVRVQAALLLLLVQTYGDTQVSTDVLVQTYGDTQVSTDIRGYAG